MSSTCSSGGRNAVADGEAEDDTSPCPRPEILMETSSGREPGFNRLAPGAIIWRFNFHGGEGAMVNEELLALLVCPMGKAPLRREGDTLICTRCGPRFSIKDDIPDMLIEDAELPAGCASLADLECVRSGDARLDD
jgi:uncharacterized protein YbaR (Trm112 family)